MSLRVAPLLVALALAGCSAPGSLPTPATPTTIPTVLGPPVQLDAWLDGLDAPLLLTFDPNGQGAFVVEQGGRIWKVDASAERALWLDLSAKVSRGSEQGLLGLAFAPAHKTTAEQGVAYVSYTDNAGDSVLSRVRFTAEAALAGSEEVILQVDQPFANHNGGHVLFGPDGFLYYGLGDGGSAGDPQGNAQDPGARLGSILRLDVSGETGYGAAEGNPWGEMWAKGLRNPWRFSFDRASGDFWVADVGQNAIEEVNVLRAPVAAGANFGWSAFEGTKRYNPLRDTSSAHTPPVAQYTHADGCSVTGGFVYRGAAHPQLVGLYFLADYCSGKLWALREQADGWHLVELLDTEHQITSFGEDLEGELYVVARGGRVLRLAATGAALPDVLRHETMAQSAWQMGG